MVCLFANIRSSRPAAHHDNRPITATRLQLTARASRRPREYSGY